MRLDYFMKMACVACTVRGLCFLLNDLRLWVCPQREILELNTHANIIITQYRNKVVITQIRLYSIKFDLIQDIAHYTCPKPSWAKLDDWADLSSICACLGELCRCTKLGNKASSTY